MRKKITDYLGKTIKDSLTNPDPMNDKNRHAETVIRNHVIWSMGASYIIPLPVADVFAVSALQLDMIRQLCRVYDIDFAETQGKAIVTSLTTSTMARAGARSLLKFVPGVGTVIGGITVAVVNGASTYALGEVFKRHFAGGGTFLDFDTGRLKKLYREQFEKGKDVAKKWREESGEAPAPPPPAPTTTPRPAGENILTPEDEPKIVETVAAEPIVTEAPLDDDSIRKIRELAEMKAQNIITEEEFEVMKRRIIG